jgi:hypothetical protein
MWAAGDLVFLLAMILALWVWLRAEEREGRLADARLDREAAHAAASAARAAPAASDAARPASATPPAGTQSPGD